jgi:ATP-binding protein involved in chromosome partitioning
MGVYAMSHQPSESAQMQQTLSNIRKRFIVLSGKGGVGKSTIAVNIAAGLALRGHHVGLLDTDLHGPSVPKMLGLENCSISGDGEHMIPVALLDARLKVMSVQFMLRQLHDSIIWRGPLKHRVISQLIGLTLWGPLDYLIIDSPPGTGDEPLSAAQTAQPDAAIIVTTPQEVATFDVRKSIDFCEKLHLPVLGVIENMSGFVCPHCGRQTAIFGFGGGEKMARDARVPFLGCIPIEPGFVISSDKGTTCIDAAGAENQGQKSLSAIIDRIAEYAAH